MRRLFLLMCLLGGAAAAPVPSTASEPGRKPVGPEYKPDVFQGRVERLNNERIMIRPEGHLRFDVTWTNPEGVREDRYYEQDNNQPARVFTFADRMLEHNGVRLPPNRGGHPAPDRGEHIIAHVLVEDIVSITGGPLSGEPLCSALYIVRRPGGRVPDAYGDDDKAYKVKTSTVRNAYQCAEETVAGKWGPRLLAALKK